MCLGPITFHEELVVRIRLDVKVAFARKADHLHREVVLNSPVEDHLSVQRPNLRALVAHDRCLEPKALDPRQRAGKGPAGAGNHCDPRAHQAADGLDISRIQLQRRAQDRAVEVEGEQPVADRCAYFFTSGLTRFGGLPPRAAVAMFRAAIADISDRVRTVALAM